MALVQPSTLRSRKPMKPRQWLCESFADRVSFRSDTNVYRFNRDEFLKPGEQPVTPG